MPKRPQRKTEYSEAKRASARLLNLLRREHPASPGYYDNGAKERNWASDPPEWLVKAVSSLDIIHKMD